MVGMIDAPVPLMVGVCKEHIEYILDKDTKTISPDRPSFVTFIDIDNNIVYEARTLDDRTVFVPPRLPVHDGSKLLKK